MVGFPLRKESTMQIADNTVAELNYRLTVDGQVVDESEESHPLAYLHGNGNIISGLERALTGKSEGDELSVTLEPNEAYGEFDETLVLKVARSQFSGVDKVEVGMQFEAEFPDGTQVATIQAIDGDEITIDGNHPLAGETLTFEVEVAGVRAATEEELVHQHVHGPGGAH
jgi:FKBP-type peptidyl-prolyl cis-trans isomerase SlyD